MGLFGSILKTVGGIAGQALIPIPGVGAAVGAAVGGAVGSAVEGGDKGTQQQAQQNPIDTVLGGLLNGSSKKTNEEEKPLSVANIFGLILESKS